MRGDVRRHLAAVPHGQQLPARGVPSSSSAASTSRSSAPRTTSSPCACTSAAASSTSSPGRSRGTTRTGRSDRGWRSRGCTPTTTSRSTASTRRSATWRTRSASSAPAASRCGSRGRCSAGPGAAGSGVRRAVAAGTAAVQGPGGRPGDGRAERRLRPQLRRFAAPVRAGSGRSSMPATDADRRSGGARHATRCAPTSSSSAPDRQASRSPRSWRPRAVTCCSSRPPDATTAAPTTTRSTATARASRSRCSAPAIAASGGPRRTGLRRPGCACGRSTTVDFPARPCRPEDAWPFGAAELAPGLRAGLSLDRARARQRPAPLVRRRTARRRWPGRVVRSWRCSSSLPMTASPSDSIACSGRPSIDLVLHSTVCQLDAGTRRRLGTSGRLSSRRTADGSSSPPTCSSSPCGGIDNARLLLNSPGRERLPDRQRTRQRRSLLHGPPQCRHRDHRAHWR